MSAKGSGGRVVEHGCESGMAVCRSHRLIRGGQQRAVCRLGHEPANVVQEGGNDRLVVHLMDGRLESKQENRSVEERRGIILVAECTLASAACLAACSATGDG